MKASSWFLFALVLGSPVQRTNPANVLSRRGDQGTSLTDPTPPNHAFCPELNDVTVEYFGGQVPAGGTKLALRKVLGWSRSSGGNVSSSDVGSGRSAGEKDCVRRCCSDPDGDCQVALMVSNLTDFSCFLAGGCLSNSRTPQEVVDSCRPIPAPAEVRGIISMALVRRGLGVDRSLLRAPGLATTPAGTMGPITVEVVSKNITLPDNTATLTAYALPEAPSGSPYSYEWTLTSEGSMKGEMENKSQMMLKVSKLEEGTYTFKVKVTSQAVPGLVGEATASVNVFPEVRKRLPPKAKVEPKVQSIFLPSKRAIVDGSMSTDDSGEKGSIVSYKWELVNVPLAYQKSSQSLPNQALLSLDDLVVGNYTLRLTVTDKEGLSGSSEMIYIYVMERDDYPPIANAGEDQIIYLPTNEVYLDGSRSKDDNGIVGWQWTTESTDDGDSVKLASDATNMRTSKPHITDLQVGTYTFTLRVFDVKGQSSEDSVNVYVKPQANSPPKAKAGPQPRIEMSLPLNWILLNGTNSTDDVGIVSYNWTQVAGPAAATLVSPQSAVTNATQLTKGTYVFKLEVKDGDENFSNDTVQVVVKQDSNSPPVAFAGNDMTVTLPQSVVIVNGSGSTDDLKIARWKWTRLPESLAAGKAIGNSTNEPVLLLMDLVPGQYLFDLEVWDDQGKSSRDSISIDVKENPESRNIVEATLNEDISSLTSGRLESLKQSLELLLRNAGGINNGGSFFQESFKSSSSAGTADKVRASDADSSAASIAEAKEGEASTRTVQLINLLPQRYTGFSIVQFMVTSLHKDGQVRVIPGLEVLSELQSKLKTGQDLLDLKFVELDTLVCQNDCSGHGSCDQSTRECLCEPFWIENFITRRLLDGQKNCGWSVIYVGIFLSAICFTIICGSAYILCKKRQRKLSGTSTRHPSHHQHHHNSRSSRSKRRYTRLDQQETAFGMRGSQGQLGMVQLLESDSESDLELNNTFDLQDTKLNSRRKQKPKQGASTISTSIPSKAKANGGVKKPLALSSSSESLAERGNGDDCVLVNLSSPSSLSSATAVPVRRQNGISFSALKSEKQSD